MRIVPGGRVPLNNPNPPDPILRAEYPLEPLWQKAVERMFRQLNWRTQHFWDAMNARAGWPDLVAWHPVSGKTIWAELKTETGRVTASQRDTLLELAIANEVWLWRPSDASEIAAVIGAGLPNGVAA